MKRLAVFMVLLFLLVNVSFAVTSDTSVYIRNQPYKGLFVIKNNTLYVPVNTLLKYLGYDWIQKDKDVQILDYRLDTPSSEIIGVDLNYYFGEKTFKADNFVQNGKLYVNAGAFAKNMQMYVMYNDQTDIYDIVLPNFNAVAVTSGTAVPTGGTGSAGSSSESSADPIVAAIQAFQDYNPANQGAGGDYRGTLNVKNTGAKKVTGIIVTVFAKTAGGEELNRQTYSIGALDAGGETSQTYYWSNPNPLMTINLTTEVKHDPIPEDKKEESADGTTVLTPTTTLEPGAQNPPPGMGK